MSSYYVYSTSSTNTFRKVFKNISKMSKTCLKVFFLICLKTTTSKYIVWNFQDFSVTEILREINIGESRSSKTAV